MLNRISDIKKQVKTKLSALRVKRKGVVGSFRKKLEEAKIKQVKSSIFNK